MIHLDDKIYHCKIGAIGLKIEDKSTITEFDESWDESESHENFYSKVFKEYKKLETHLKGYPDISNVEWVSELRIEHMEPFEHFNDDAFYLPESSSFISFDVFIPKSERKYAYDVRYHNNVIEKATILYNGNIFLAFGQYNYEMSTSFFGQEIREFLKKCLKVENLRPTVIPPCPIHPDIDLNFIKDSESNISVNEDNDISIELAEEYDESIIYYFTDFIYENMYWISEFLSEATLNQKLEKISWEIRDINDEITEMYEKMLELKCFKIIKRIKVMKMIRKESIKLQVMNNEYSKLNVKLHNFKDKYKRNNSNGNNLFREYCYGYFKFPIISLSENRETLRYMNDIVTNNYNQLSNLFSAVIGAVIGIAITKIPDLVQLVVNLLGR